MIIKICDRCGKIIMTPQYQIKLDGGLGYDYCPVCMAEMRGEQDDTD